ncbi:MAG TPA: hypothetical protein VEX38_09870 [Fimbriimonadaceae bacterium]|nr:hypothetical protein [Fimbriimonadaceae bacterium]
MAKGTSGIPVVQISGALGNVVFARRGNTLTVRERVPVRNPRTEAQVSARATLAEAAKQYGQLSDEQLEAWSRYAASLSQDPPANGYTAYMKLAAKYLRVNPGGTPPALPPTSVFFGDAIAVSAAGAPGEIVFTALAPNASDIVTELLLQPLPSRTRGTNPRNWRSAAYVSFAHGELEHVLPVQKGWYAVAYRFVNSVTGQETGMAALGKRHVS